jgi:hypothetical protein
MSCIIFGCGIGSFVGFTIEFVITYKKLKKNCKNREDLVDYLPDCVIGILDSTLIGGMIGCIGGFVLYSIY